MKYVFIATVLVFVAGCVSEAEQSIPSTSSRYVGKTYELECIDGVEYWFRGRPGYRGYLAPRIDPETLAYVLCTD
jgi:hypothetical protein